MMARPALADRGRASSPRTRSGPTAPSSTSAARRCTPPAGCGTRSSEAYAAGYLGREHPRLRVRPGPRRAQRRRRLHLRRGDRAAGLAGGLPRAAAAAAAVPGHRRPLRLPDRGQQRRDHRQRARPSCWAARTGSGRWAREKSPGPKIYSLSGRVTQPGPVRVLRWASRCASCSSWPAACRTGHQLKFWTPGGSSTPLLTAEHLDVPLDFEGVAAAGSMLGTTAMQIFSDQDCPVLRDVPVDRVLPPRVVRQVHPVPGGQLLDGADPPADPAPARARPRTSTPCSTSATTSSAARSARSVTARPARSPRRSSTSSRTTWTTSRAARPPKLSGEQLAGAH